MEEELLQAREEMAHRVKGHMAEILRAGDELKAITGSWKTRSAQYELFAHDEEMKQLMNDEKIILIGYRPLRDLQRRERRDAAGR